MSVDNLVNKALKRIGAVHPVIKQGAEEIIRRAYKQGIYVLFSDGYRSHAEQNALYAQGRTKPGQIVTNAKGGQSLHNYGLALDMFITNKEGTTATWSTNKLREVAQIAKSLGFEWGGDWTGFKDYPHIQMTGGLTLSQLQAGKKPNIKLKNVSQSTSKPSTSKPSTSKPKPTPNKPTTSKTGKVLHLPKTSSSWRVYPTNKAPTKGNEKGYLNPKKFGGLTYDIIGNPQKDVYTIKTGDFGTVNIYAASSTGAKVTNKTSSNKTQAKGTVHLPASAKTWRTYKLNVQPVAKNSDWSLTPSRYGGLTYTILGRPYPDVVTINTSKGKRNIYVGKGTGAVVK